MIDSNPFSTRYVQPGRIPFQLRSGVTVEQLVDRFLRVWSRRAAIIGPHGSGKSSLLETMLKSFPGNYMVSQFRLNSASVDAENSISRWVRESQSWHNSTIVTIDGYEQLGWWTQYRIGRLIKKSESRLLVTTHKPIRGFSVLWATHQDFQDDAYVLNNLLAHTQQLAASPKLMDEALICWSEIRLRYPTDMREALMQMYDWWEKKTARNF